ncbi:MAG TPA: hypothetical protein VM100_10190, partial [Longimicrobiales bacterium]|nr:hypothetical protein [Longimicrobiales bacterium]
MNQPRTSRHRFRSFLQDYKLRRLDERSSSELPKPTASKGLIKAWLAKGGNQRSYLGSYFRWLYPHRWGIGAVFLLAIIAA